MIAKAGQSGGHKFRFETEFGKTIGGEAAQPIHSCRVGRITIDLDHLAEHIEGDRKLLLKETFNLCRILQCVQDGEKLYGDQCALQCAASLDNRETSLGVVIRAQSAKVRWFP